MDDCDFNLFKKAQFINHCLQQFDIAHILWSYEIGDINITYRVAIQN